MSEIDKELIQEIAAVVKARFPNLSVQDTLTIVLEIVSVRAIGTLKIAYFEHQ